MSYEHLKFNYDRDHIDGANILCHYVLYEDVTCSEVRKYHGHSFSNEHHRELKLSVVTVAVVGDNVKTMAPDSKYIVELNVDESIHRFPSLNVQLDSDAVRLSIVVEKSIDEDKSIYNEICKKIQNVVSKSKPMFDYTFYGCDKLERYEKVFRSIIYKMATVDIIREPQDNPHVKKREKFKINKKCR